MTVEVLGLCLRIVKSIADIRSRVVPECGALAILAVALTTTGGPVQSSAIAGECVNVGVDLAGEDHVADLVGLRYDIGVEGGETLVDYRIEVWDFA